MYYQKKFAKAAQRRRFFAFTAAILLHFAIFAAISGDKDWKDFIPEFLTELVQGKESMKENLPRP